MDNFLCELLRTTLTLTKYAPAVLIWFHFSVKYLYLWRLDGVALKCWYRVPELQTHSTDLKDANSTVGQCPKELQKHTSILSHKSIREGCRKKTEQLCPFDKPGGEGQKKKKANLYFGKVFFQWACRIILGPLKHVLHLVLSPNAIAKAFNVI